MQTDAMSNCYHAGVYYFPKMPWPKVFYFTYNTSV